MRVIHEWASSNLKCWFTDLLVMGALVATFIHSNNTVQREVSKQGKRELRNLLAISLNILACIWFVYFMCSEKELYHGYLFDFIIYRCFDTELIFVWRVISQLAAISAEFLLGYLVQFVLDSHHYGPHPQTGDHVFQSGCCGPSYRTISHFPPGKAALYQIEVELNCLPCVGVRVGQVLCVRRTVLAALQSPSGRPTMDSLPVVHSFSGGVQLLLLRLARWDHPLRRLPDLQGLSGCEAHQKVEIVLFETIPKHGKT